MPLKKLLKQNKEDISDGVKYEFFRDRKTVKTKVPQDENGKDHGEKQSFFRNGEVKHTNYFWHGEEVTLQEWQNELKLAAERKPQFPSQPPDRPWDMTPRGH